MSESDSFGLAIECPLKLEWPHQSKIQQPTARVWHLVSTRPDARLVRFLKLVTTPTNCCKFSVHFFFRNTQQILSQLINCHTGKGESRKVNSGKRVAFALLPLGGCIAVQDVHGCRVISFQQSSDQNANGHPHAWS